MDLKWVLDFKKQQNQILGTRSSSGWVLTHLGRTTTLFQNFGIYITHPKKDILWIILHYQIFPHGGDNLGSVSTGILCAWDSTQFYFQLKNGDAPQVVFIELSGRIERRLNAKQMIKIAEEQEDDAQLELIAKKISLREYVLDASEEIQINHCKIRFSEIFQVKTCNKENEQNTHIRGKLLYFDQTNRYFEQYIFNIK